MCGIVGCLGHRDLSAAVAALQPRGPDFQQYGLYGGCSLGHTRLAIQDPQPRSHQPYTFGPVTIAYNGELFNGPEIRQLCEQRTHMTWETTGDTETVAAALAILGPEYALGCFDWMGALIWVDVREPGALHLARDRMGEVPLTVHVPARLAASELKAMRALGLNTHRSQIADVTPGAWWVLHAGVPVRTRQINTVPAGDPSARPLEAKARALYALTAQAVKRRAISDVPVCTLLSGGIDSAVICAQLREHVPDLTAYTAVLNPKSPDLRAARECADALGVKLVEIPVDPPTADDLAATVCLIEMPFKAQVEIGWPCLQLARQMSADGFKVTYSGEGSDELWGSYGFAYHGIKAHGWTGYRRDLTALQARKNFPRVNKAFASEGIEARLPWLDPDLVAFCLGCSQFDATNGHLAPKGLLQAAYQGVLPDRLLRRPKLAFQDGLGMKDAAAAAVARPERFYRAEFTRAYG